MHPPYSELDAAVRLAIAALVATGVGLERERSGHAQGPHGRFAGLRTFLLLGLLAGAAGLCTADGFTAAGAVLAAGGMAFSIVAFAIADHPEGEPLDGTTEAAALAIIGIGILAGIGWIALAAGAGAVMVLALNEKARLHDVVRHVGDAELRGALQFAVLALVVLPLLPPGPLWPPLNVEPRALWSVVLIVSGLNYVGFLARRAVGAERGQAVTGLLGGLTSSTLVTLDFARRSRSDGDSGAALAAGVVGACTLLFPRVAVVAAVLNPNVATTLMPLLVGPALVGAALLRIGWPAGSPAVAATAARPDQRQNPLQLWVAIRLALLFQAAMILLAVARNAWGTGGLNATAALLGFSDVDAMTAAMSRPSAGIPAHAAAYAIVIGILANTVLKLAITLGVGRGAFRIQAARGLGIIGAVTAAVIYLAGL